MDEAHYFLLFGLLFFVLPNFVKRDLKNASTKLDETEFIPQTVLLTAQASFSEMFVRRLSVLIIKAESL